MVKELKADVIVDAFSGVTYGEVKKIFDSSGVTISKSKPDFVIMVGGDGTYLRHAPHNMDIPILKLKGREHGPLGSKGVLYTYSFDSLAACIRKIKSHDYKIRTEPVIKCVYNKKT
jgi:ATP-NAD kinase.